MRLALGYLACMRVRENLYLCVKSYEVDGCTFELSEGNRVRVLSPLFKLRRVITSSNQDLYCKV